LLYFLVLGICAISATTIVTTIQCWMNMVDVTLSVNVSQPHRIQFITEYFVDEEKYIFLILLHINAAFCIGITATLATGTMLLGLIQFIFGMFKISRYETNIKSINIEKKESKKNVTICR